METHICLICLLFDAVFTINDPRDPIVRFIQLSPRTYIFCAGTEVIWSTSSSQGSDVLDDADYRGLRDSMRRMEVVIGYYCRTFHAGLSLCCSGIGDRMYLFLYL